MKNTQSKSKVNIFHSISLSLLHHNLGQKSLEVIDRAGRPTKPTSKNLQSYQDQVILPIFRNDDCYLMGHQELERAIGFDPL